MDNSFIPIVTILVLIFLSTLFNSKRKFFVVNLVLTSLLCFYYLFMVYFKLEYAFDYVNAHSTEALFINAERIFDNIVLHLGAVVIFVIVNFSLIYVRFWKCIFAKTEKGSNEVST